MLRGTFFHKAINMAEYDMRTTVDIPDPLYRELKVRAASEGRTIREMILEGIEVRLRDGGAASTREGRPRFPAIRSKNPGTLKPGKEGVYEYIPFP
jgi:hypothetical protein